jgi:chitodextrinase
LTNESDYIDIDVTSGSVQVTGGSNPPSPPSGPPDNPPAEENTPPNAPVKPVGPTLVESGTVYQYNNSAVDPDGDSVRLRFDWGDGSLSAWSALVASNTSVSASHAWTNVSNYPIRVIAQDASGSNSSWSETLTVMISQIESEGFPPVGSFHIPGNASVNHSMVFDASGSYDPDGAIVSYVWDFGDGITGVGEILVHTYESPGEYTVTLTVTDNAGMNYSSSQVVRITDSSDASTGAGAGFLKPNDIMILLVALGVTGLVLLFVYRYRTREVSLEKQIDASKQRLAIMDQGTADIDQIVDALFAEVQHRKQTPRIDTLLDAYNALIIGRVEKNPAIAIPTISIDKVESLVDRRIHAMIVEKIERL